MAEQETGGLFDNKFIQTALIVLLIVGAYMLGSLKTKVDILQKGGLTTAGTAQTVQPQAATQQTAPQPQAAKATLDQLKDVFNKSLVKFGDTKKKLVLIEVADPSCPYCHVAAGKDGELNKQIGNQFTLVADGGTYVAPVPEMKKLIDSGKAAFAWLYSPGHGSGEMGTKAAYCAFEKGKFWEVHDLLMSNAGYNLLNQTVKNDKTKSGDVAEFLKSVFNPADMKNCLDSGKYDARLSQDNQLASSIDISGTPGFYVNDTKFAGAYSFKDMESAVSSALK